MRKVRGKAEGICHIGNKRAEIAVVHSEHVRVAVGMFQFAGGVHLKQNLQPETACHTRKRAARVHSEHRSDEQHSRSPAKTCLKKLILVNYEILIQHGQSDA